MILTKPAELIASVSMWVRMEEAVEWLAEARTPRESWEAEQEVIAAFSPIHGKKSRGKFTPVFRGRVFARDGYACVRCGAPRPAGWGAEIDHLFPVILGGCSRAWNLATVCTHCNKMKGHSLLPWALLLMIRQARGGGE